MSMDRSETEAIVAWLDGLAAAERPDPMELARAATLDPGTLDDSLDRLTLLRVIDRHTSWSQSKAYAVIYATADIETDLDGTVRTRRWAQEVSRTRRVGSAAASTAIEVAHTLHECAAMSALFDAGRISDGHVRVLDAALHRLGTRARRRILPELDARAARRAWRQSPQQLRTTLDVLICRLDPHGQADRHRAAHTRRYVSHRAAPDGMGELHLLHDITVIDAIIARVDAAARTLQLARGGAPSAVDNPDALRSACRADALAALLLCNADTVLTRPRPATCPATGDAFDLPMPDCSADAVAQLMGSLPPQWCVPPATIEAHLVLDLATLRSEADHASLLDGTPVPAPVGRHLARAAATWRRMVTDPVTGHLLDYGTRTYLPGALRRFVLARDRRCNVPYCERPIAEMDHRIPYPVGPSSAANCDGKCKLHHQLKTLGLLTVTDGRADGSATYTTWLGQVDRVEPRPFLDTGAQPDDEPWQTPPANSPQGDDDPEPPPF